MKKLLYIGKEISEISSGADSVNHRNIKFLQQIFGIENIEFVALGINVLYDKIVGYLGGLNNKIENEIILKLKSQEYDYVFISHSCLGRLAKKIKRNFGAKIKIISFYHNIEKHYAKEYKRVAGIAKLPFLLSVSYNEKQCVFYSDYNIVLNERDSKLMQKYYNKKSDLILPVSYEDKFVKNSVNRQQKVDTIYYKN